MRAYGYFMGYALIIYYCYFFINSEKNSKMIIISFLFCSLFVSGIGTFQYLGYDIFNAPQLQKLFDPDNYGLAISEGGIFSTLFIIQIILAHMQLWYRTGAFYLFIYDTDIVLRIFYLIDMVFTVIALYGSESATGIIAVIAEMFSLFFMWRL